MASSISLPSFAAKVENLVDQNGQSSSQFLPPGIIFPYAGAGSAPAGYLLCDGSAVSQTIYPRLFAVLQFTWGNPGGGSFNLPNGRGAFLRGTGTNGVHVGPADVGQAQTQATAKNGLNTVNNLVSSTPTDPAHRHSGNTFSAKDEPTGGKVAVASEAGGTFGSWDSHSLHRGGFVAGTTPDGSFPGQDHIHDLITSVTSISHSHNVTSDVTLTTGDTETRPNSFGVQYIIKI